jgi:hypothetical protein
MADSWDLPWGGRWVPKNLVTPASGSPPMIAPPGHRPQGGGRSSCSGPGGRGSCMTSSSRSAAAGARSSEAPCRWLTAIHARRCCPDTSGDRSGQGGTGAAGTSSSGGGRYGGLGRRIPLRAGGEAQVRMTASRRASEGHGGGWTQGQQQGIRSVPWPGQPPSCMIRAALFSPPKAAPWFPAAMASKPASTIDVSTIFGSHVVGVWSARRAAGAPPCRSGLSCAAAVLMSCRRGWLLGFSLA